MRGQILFCTGGVRAVTPLSSQHTAGDFYAHRTGKPAMRRLSGLPIGSR